MKNLIDSPFHLRAIDISQEVNRHTVIARGSENVYYGHPTTVLLPDRRTVFCVWTRDHGGACGFMKRSDDGGVTWSDLVELPTNWQTVKNCPTIYRLPDPQEKHRLFVFAGQGLDGSMHQSVSEDNGATWSPMRSNGLFAVMPFCSVLPIDQGQRLLAMTNTRRGGVPGTNIITQTVSDDGGFTWHPWTIVADGAPLNFCEPWVIRSPNRQQLLCLLRENTYRASYFITSDDEGKTWSSPQPLPIGLAGDRHVARYAVDGRLVVCFRDRALRSGTTHHFVAWVGTYEDIIENREGQYRLKLLHSHHKWDCGYPGLEVLDDGTLLATTYLKYRVGKARNSIVATRFRLDEMDQRVIR